MLMESWIFGYSAVIRFSLLCRVRVAKKEHILITEFCQPYLTYANKAERGFPIFSNHPWKGPLIMSNIGTITASDLIAYALMFTRPEQLKIRGCRR